MAEPKEIGTVWTLGCEVFVEDALTAEVQEIKVNDIVLSANIFTEGLSVEVGSDMVNAMDLDVRISMDGLKTYIIDSQIVPYEEVLKITDFSQEATNEKRYAASALSAKKIYDKTGVLESGLSALKKRVDEIELNGVGGSGDSVWKIDKQGNIWTDKQVIIKNNLIVEGDTSSGGEGEDTPSVGLDETRLQEYLDEHKYVTEYDIEGLIPSNIATVDYVNTKFNSIDLSPYAKTTELNALANRVTPIETWMDNVGQHITYDAELDAIVINHDLIVTKDTSSGGEGEDTPAGGGIRGIYVNGTPYTDTDGDGFIDLGTISGGVSEITASMITSALGYTPANGEDYLPLAGGRITCNSLDIGREDNYAGAFVKIITNASTSADYGTSIRHYEKSSGTYTYKGLLIDKNGAYYSNNGSNYNLIHSGNYSSFALPLSGGTLESNTTSTVLKIKGSTNAWIGYYGPAGYLGEIGYVGMMAHCTDTNGNVRPIIHTGNIGSQSVAGIRIGEQIRTQEALDAFNDGKNLRFVGVGSVLPSPIVSSDGMVISIPWYNTTFGAQIAIDDQSNVMMLRTRNQNVWRPWSRIIGEDDNGNVVLNGAYLYAKNYLFMNTDGEGIYLSTDAISWHNAGNGRVKDLIVFNSSGNIDIGGQINVSHNSNKNYAFIAQDDYTSNTSWMKLGTCYGSQTETVAMTIYNGMVKIGNAIPTCELDVNGGIKATKPIFGYMYVTNKNAAAFIFDKPGSNYTGIGSDGVSDTIRFGACNVQGEWVDYNQKWKFYGDIIVTGDTSSGSDIRFKDIIKDKTLKIEHIAKAPLFTFRWNDREDDTIHLGSSAQYWEKVCPWLVTGEDFKSLNYATLGVAMGISLAKKAVNHEARIKELEKEIKRLKEEMRYGDR